MSTFGKRKADDFMAPPAAPPGNQRIAEFKGEGQKNPDRLWDSFMNDYLTHAKRLRAEFQDVIEGGGAAEAPAVAGTVFVFGQGDMGQLGLGDDETEMLVPGPLPMPGGMRVTQIVCGGMHSLALTEDGKVWSWGVNDEGALGREARGGELASIEGETTGSETVPERVHIPGDVKIKYLTAGDSHSGALSETGQVFAWGVFRDSGGRFGFSASEKLTMRPVMIRVGNDTVKQIASGADHMLALTSKGQVFSWGCAECGRLGRVEDGNCDPKAVKGDKKTWEARLLTPTLVPSLPEVKFIAAGLYCSFAVGARSEVLAWGLNQYGQLAIEQEGPFYAPTSVPALSNKSIVQIGGGEHHSLALSESGDVYAFGRPTYGRLGRRDVNPNQDDRHWNPGKVEGIAGGAVVSVVGGLSVSGAVEGISGGAVVSVVGGLSVSGAVTDKGAVYMWGTGGDGLLAKKVVE
ncbi:regulator of chromosome condensation 1/beta-lactamase-inhibitor protein II [Baffinella frigidus]|nr:regulator of chromosome condensation 1/beta-lactamase-inhibitor protein II [Cryptophyta sp. CCMP2293]